MAAGVFEVAGRTVRNGGRPFLVAEVGINHNGSVRLAERMIAAAKEAGADAVKFQFLRRGRLVNPGLRESGPVLKVLDRCVLPDGAMGRLKRFADRVGLVWFATVFDEEAVGILEGWGVELYKVASGDVVNRPLLERVVRTGRPVLCSTGAATLREVDAAVGVLSRSRGGFGLLHCVSLYPAPLERMNLRTVPYLARRYGCVSGLSDHTAGSEAAEWSVALGAAVVEKHFTLDKGLPGPDHRLSVTPKELARLRRRLDLVVQAVGVEGKRVLEEEVEGHFWGRRSPVAARALRRGERVGREDVVLLRPQAGLPTSAWGRLVGRRVRRDIGAGELFREGDV